MYRVTFTNSRGRTLVGNMYENRSKSIIVLCHGLTSDKNSQGRFPQLASALQTVGYNVLTFDFSGCGESDDDILTIDKELDDLQSAISYVQAQSYIHIGLYGHSLGAYICLLYADKDIDTMVLTGALTDKMSYRWEDYFTKQQLDELHSTNHMVFPVKQESRTSVIISEQILDVFSLVDQESLLTGIRKPILLIHGDGDDEEKSLLANTKRGMKYLPPGSSLEVIKGAPHNFMDYMDRVTELSIRWFIQKIPRT